MADATRLLLSAMEPKLVSPPFESVLDQAWVREMDAYLARLRPRAPEGGEPGCADSSEVSDISTGALRPKEKTRTLRIRAAQRLRRLLVAEKKSTLSEFMSFLETADGHRHRPRARAVLQPSLVCGRESLEGGGFTGSCAASQPGSRQARQQQPPAIIALSERLAAALPKQDACSFQLGGVERGGRRAGSSGTSEDGHRSADCGGLLSQVWSC